METTFDYLRQFGPLLAERILETYPPLQSTKDPLAPDPVRKRDDSTSHDRSRAIATAVTTIEYIEEILTRSWRGLLQRK